MADQIWMQFEIVGRMVPGMLGFGICPRERVILGANVGQPIVTDGKFAALRCKSA